MKKEGATKEMRKKKTYQVKNGPLGSFVRSRRESNGITKADACRQSGLDYSYWIKLEAGVYEMPSPKALDLVANVIRCKPTDLYVLAGYRIGGDLPGLGPYLRSKYSLPPEAIDQLESYFKFLRHQYGIADDEPVFPPKARDERQTKPHRDERRAA